MEAISIIAATHSLNEERCKKEEKRIITQVSQRLDLRPELEILRLEVVSTGKVIYWWKLAEELMFDENIEIGGKSILSWVCINI